MIESKHQAALYTTMQYKAGTGTHLPSEVVTMLSNFKLPMPNDIGHVLQTITEDGEMHLAICHADGTAWNPITKQRFPAHVLRWLQSHRYAGSLFERNSIVWVDYEPPEWMKQSNTHNA